MPQISQIGNRSLRDQIFGGALIPLSPLKTFFWFLPEFGWASAGILTNETWVTLSAGIIRLMQKCY
jgi:hypothetical protein